MLCRYNKIDKLFRIKTCTCVLNNKLCDGPKKTTKTPQSNDDSNLNLGDFASKYKVYKDDDSEVILDVYEERLKYSNQLEETPEEPDAFEGINLKRGERGVFDIEDLVHLLNRENGENIFVASVPPEINYVEHICVVTGKSLRHMKAIIQFVRRVYKRKRYDYDLIPKVEGVNSKDWMALDLGNIALHVMTNEARAKYDLDSLWAVGPEYDEESNKKDDLVEMLEKHSIYLKDLQPAT